MANLDLIALVSGKQKRTPSSSNTVDFLSIKVGASGLEIKETSSQFDFSNKKLTNLAQGTAPGHAVVLDSNTLVPLTMIPPAALERLVVVADQTARYALTTATVQNGDTVKQTDTGEMWYVIDDSNLSNSSGYAVYTAGTASSVPWSGITGKPTTLTGYGVSDSDVVDSVIAAFVSGAGTVTSSDTIVSAINKLDGNIANKLDSSAFTDTAVTGKLITGFTSGAGTVTATDTILQAIQKLDGNVTALSGGSTSTKSLVNDNAGSITAGQVVYIKDNGNVDLAQANVANLDTFQIGIVKDASIATTASGNIYVIDGLLLSGFSSLTPGAKVYVSRSTAGALTQSLTGFVAGEFVYCVGRAISATEIAYDPEFEFEY